MMMTYHNLVMLQFPGIIKDRPGGVPHIPRIKDRTGRKRSDDFDRLVFAFRL